MTLDTLPLGPPAPCLSRTVSTVEINNSIDKPHIARSGHGARDDNDNQHPSGAIRLIVAPSPCQLEASKSLIRAQDF
jgi:hypothetical protein